MIDKNFYTTQELTQQPWFPVKSPITLKKLIEAGVLEAVNISSNPKMKRYRISKESVINFLVNRDERYKQFVVKDKNGKTNKESV
jgi:hypothetical protein